MPAAFRARQRAAKRLRSTRTRWGSRRLARTLHCSLVERNNGDGQRATNLAFGRPHPRPKQTPRRPGQRFDHHLGGTPDEPRTPLAVQHHDEIPRRRRRFSTLIVIAGQTGRCPLDTGDYQIGWFSPVRAPYKIVRPDPKPCKGALGLGRGRRSERRMHQAIG